MDKKDWVVPLISGVIGVAGGVGGAMTAGYYQERAAFQQAQVEMTKIEAADKTAGIKELKDAAAHYLAENDALLNAVVLSPKKEKVLVDHLTKVQTAGAVLIVLADDELARYTSSVNAYSASLLSGGNQPPIDQRLSQLATIRAEWMKQLRRSLDALKKQSDENLTVRSSR
ncbi:hypothetical protein [Chromobacterium subtsugae]|uniref:hypothetical protein n=1 Tax=Chromobacterium subtsugae TaxID=251747 RepID=UPI00128D7A82|nr:hypothetical protein [Chromobacterium subtsugae]